MLKIRTICLAFALAGLTLKTTAHAQVVADFEDLSLGGNASWSGTYPIDGVGGTGLDDTFGSQGIQFHNFSDGDWNFWNGFAYSNINDTTTPGFTNQFAAYTGSGSGGSGNYGIAYEGPIVVTLPVATTVESVEVTNTTYAALAMLNGDGFSKKFGGDTGDDADFFELTIAGKDVSGNVTGSVDVYLADYRFADNVNDFILDTWLAVDLTSLGGNVKTLEFDLSSSDNHPTFGMNTPAYFALDNLTVTQIPEPGSVALLGIGAAAIATRRRRV